jgi:GT2 family glycosyltransferase
MKEKVCAVVVTFNRVECLKRLIKCLREQTYTLSDIIVVNNGSTDATSAWLDTQELIKITQENEGSGGGFYSGIKKTLEHNYDYVWIMDDDGYPDEKCLENLISSPTRKTYGPDIVLASMVINPDNKNELSFHLPDLRSRHIKVFDHYSVQTDKVADVLTFKDKNGYPWAFFFNSVLLPTPVIKKVGLPKKELFIWGDEVEYFYRIKKLGVKIYMIPQSIFFHPKLVMAKAAKWKEKYGTRNYVYIHRLYKPFPLIHHLLALVKIITARKFYLLAPFYHGLKGDFSKKYHNPRS